MTYASGQAIVVIDCDLQDPPRLIPEMVRLWRDGNKVVIPQRTSREGETLDQAHHLVRRLLGHQPDRHRPDPAQHGRLSACSTGGSPGRSSACRRATASCAG